MISEIKSRINCIEYAQMAGLSVKRSGERTTSIAGGSNKTACILYEDWFYDFKLDQGGDVIDLCALLKHDGDKREAIMELAELTGAKPEMSENWRQYTQNLCHLIQKWHEALRPEDRLYLKTRGITEATIERLKIGYNGRLVIPYFKNGYVSYYITRGEDPKYKKAKLDGLNENVPWGLHTIKETNQQLIIAEGAFDAISFEQEGYSVLATMGGHFSKDQLKTVLSICKQFDQVFVCFDNDDAGSGFTVDFSKQLFQYKIDFVCGNLPKGYKDVSEYYQDGGKLENLIENAENGLQGLCEKITDKAAFKNFVFKAARFVGKPELAELFSAAKGRFPSEWFEEVKKMAMTAPSEDLIAKDITEKHRLRFVEALGFYEYQRGTWHKKNDTEIQAYIGEELGRYRTGSRITSILKLIKSDCITTDIFDQKPIFNFINGTLDLENFEFRAHNENDLCSMQVGYPYNTLKDCPKWKQFIREICNFDDKRMMLLQEIAGYVLFNDNSLQKCFFLIGEGANGKSVFLDVLGDVFGNDNISNVEMSGLIEAFQRIQLLTSILNISTETQTNIKGAESVFKQIVVGDYVSGCFKNKDFVKFRPRSKLILACNEFIKSKDMTHGFIRRICFVKFENRFVDDPKGKNELKRDNNITETLKTELPGIFNWVLEGYALLKNTKDFTKTDDEDDLIKDFSETINPILIFIQEHHFGDEIVFKDLYEDYKMWCVEAGHQARNRTGFVKAFKGTFMKMNPQYSEFKSGTVRGIRCPKESAEQLKFRTDGRT
ncbi:MAG: phage/plasmid primase, P4 family [Eubacterium sp.]